MKLPIVAKLSLLPVALNIRVVKVTPFMLWINTEIVAMPFALPFLVKVALLKMRAIKLCYYSTIYSIMTI